MSYNTVLKTSMPAHYLVRSPFWQPTVYPLTGYTSPLHTPYHSCMLLPAHKDYPRTVGGASHGGGLACPPPTKKFKTKFFFFFLILFYMCAPLVLIVLSVFPEWI